LSLKSALAKVTGDPVSKKKKRAESMAQVLEHLACMPKALGSVSNTTSAMKERTPRW
jgi:hypothetical protein